MSYWTLPGDWTGPEVTLCERHALEATNISSRIMGMAPEPFTSMEEAAVVMNAYVAAFGNGGPGFQFVVTDLGWCGECQAEMDAFHHAGGIA